MRQGGHLHWGNEAAEAERGLVCVLGPGNHTECLGPRPPPLGSRGTWLVLPQGSPQEGSVCRPTFLLLFPFIPHSQRTQLIIHSTPICPAFGLEGIALSLPERSTPGLSGLLCLLHLFPKCPHLTSVFISLLRSSSPQTQL